MVMRMSFLMMETQEVCSFKILMTTVLKAGGVSVIQPQFIIGLVFLLELKKNFLNLKLSFSQCGEKITRGGNAELKTKRLILKLNAER